MKNFATIIHKWTEKFPDKVAYAFSANGLEIQQQLTYNELYRKVRAVAAVLQHKQLTHQPVILIYSSTIDFVVAFLACLQTGIIAVPANSAIAHPAQKTIPLLKSIIDSTQAKTLLTTQEVINYYENNTADFKEIHQLNKLFTDNIPDKLGDDYYFFEADPNIIAYLQYTSGSTAHPKGVITTYQNLLHNLATNSDIWNYQEESITLTWTPHFHVFGLTAGLLLPLINGNTSYIIPTDLFYNNPLAWLSAITKYKVTHSGGPNFAYEHCVTMINPKNLTGLDLKYWQVAINGGEIVKYETLVKFTKMFGDYGFKMESFFPAYGMSEHAGLIAAKRSNMAINLKNYNDIKSLTNKYYGNDINFVSCGKPIDGAEIAIIEPTTLTKLPVDQIGEICLQSPALSPGYWQKKFTSEYNKSYRYFDPETKQYYFRTGDLGFLADNEIYLTGRLKDLIIINGKNYYPIDIEKIILNSVKELQNYPLVVFSVEEGTTEKVVAVQEANLLINNLSKLTKKIRENVLLQYGIVLHEIQFIAEKSMPRTSSGKIQKFLCKQYYLENELDVIYSDLNNFTPSVSQTSLLDELQKIPNAERIDFIVNKVKKLMAELLNLADSTIDINGRFFELGMNSLIAVEFKNHLQQLMPTQIELPTTLLFDYPDISKIAHFLFNNLFPDIASDINDHASSLQQHNEQIMSEEDILALIERELGDIS